MPIFFNVLLKGHGISTKGFAHLGPLNGDLYFLYDRIFFLCANYIKNLKNIDSLFTNIKQIENLVVN